MKLSNEADDLRRERSEQFMMKLLQLLEIKDSTPLEDVQKVFYTCQMTASAYFSKLEKIAENINAGYYDNLSNETTNFNELKNAAEEAIPQYFIAMRAISVKFKLNFTDKLDKKKYPNILSLMKGKLSSQDYDAIENKWT